VTNSEGPRSGERGEGSWRLVACSAGVTTMTIATCSIASRLCDPAAQGAFGGLDALCARRGPLRHGDGG
jgi:hypothetical protein